MTFLELDRQFLCGKDCVKMLKITTCGFGSTWGWVSVILAWTCSECRWWFAHGLAAV